ncbi:shikimate dehydrogenase [Viridibacillus sp. FSL R5-0477]|uniref:Shikimate dehydrogenase (NADP(+)) n=1 Tax=Viridibacillus arenosi FSL R5-213 TaxID=1227360 RepID=W4EQ65_9BACL|nr:MULTISPECIES: shikimate dehydrogenase [Viridibacillus]ETT82384.1 shikimate dehydrogenase [Viridibacillus arenosi FSL R5-213]OMC85365.1 shikimate dehydrogenase [Viridibacillus sp. FSL H8-0123]OMC87357.1 shikimate dehydrogenase [Viridibacillus sp. FSL H7-0596]OMC92518.1 shikimate dehydrogenase [Viridibacillus arenosi]
MKKWFAVIGDPIEHSMSPAMHNQWFSAENLDAAYLPIHVLSEQLEEAISSLKMLGASGWNVTIPHKTSIIPYLDELDTMAEKMGAVNTVVRQADGKLKGYNTDGLGFVRSLEEAIGDAHRDGRVLLIGAGGAARGIAFALKHTGYQTITIANRTVANAEQICKELGSSANAISLKEAEATLGDYDILIQTTPAGLKNGTLQLPFELDQLSTKAIVADIVYNPLMTPFLQAAEQRGATVVTGLGMFVHQGALAFNYWLGQFPNTTSMKESLTEQLGGNNVNR